MYQKKWAVDVFFLISIIIEPVSGVERSVYIQQRNRNVYIEIVIDFIIRQTFNPFVSNSTENRKLIYKCNTQSSD